jgi:membrane protein YdbS with pleckstrin-like domain
MTQKEISFQGQDPHEHFQFYFRQHWMRMLWPAFRALLGTLGIVAIALALAWSGVSTTSGRMVTIVLMMFFLVIVQLQFLERFYRYFLFMVIITDQKIHRIKKTLFSRDDHQMISLWALQELQKSQRGPIQNLLGFGTIVLEAQDTQIRLHFVPDITKHYGVLLKLLGRVQAEANAQGKITNNK